MASQGSSYRTWFRLHLTNRRIGQQMQYEPSFCSHRIIGSNEQWSSQPTTISCNEQSSSQPTSISCKIQPSAFWEEKRSPILSIKEQFATIHNSGIARNGLAPRFCAQRLLSGSRVGFSSVR